MRRLSVLLGLAALLAAVPAALAAAGITPISPKRGDTVPAGSRPVFKGKVRGKGQVFVHVCTSPKRDRRGVICHDAAIGRAKKANGRFTYRAKFFDYPEFWLNTPGTYYWQAHRVSCERSLTDCQLEGPVVKFRVE